MQYTRLGQTGLEVSRICLGCMSFGDAKRGDRAWVLDEDAEPADHPRGLGGGINFFDTANVYSAGTSEEITGTVLKELAPRDEMVLATKVNGEMRKGPNGHGPVAQGDHAARSTIRCAGSAPTMSTSTRSTASTTTRRSRRRSRRCTTS